MILILAVWLEHIKMMIKPMKKESEISIKVPSELNLLQKNNIINNNNNHNTFQKCHILQQKKNFQMKIIKIICIGLTLLKNVNQHKKKVF